MTTVMVPLLAMTLAGQEAPAPLTVALFVSPGYSAEQQTRSIVFWIGDHFYRIPYPNAQYLLCDDDQGKRRASYRIRFRPDQAPGIVLFGVGTEGLRPGTFLYFAAETDDQGRLIDEECFRILSVSPASFSAQLEPHDPR